MKGLLRNVFWEGNKSLRQDSYSTKSYIVHTCTPLRLKLNHFRTSLRLKLKFRTSENSRTGVGLVKFLMGGTFRVSALVSDYAFRTGVGLLGKVRTGSGLFGKVRTGSGLVKVPTPMLNNKQLPDYGFALVTRLEKQGFGLEEPFRTVRPGRCTGM